MKSIHELSSRHSQRGQSPACPMTGIKLETKGVQNGDLTSVASALELVTPSGRAEAVAPVEPMEAAAPPAGPPAGHSGSLPEAAAASSQALVALDPEEERRRRGRERASERERERERKERELCCIFGRPSDVMSASFVLLRSVLPSRTFSLAQGKS